MDFTEERGMLIVKTLDDKILSYIRVTGFYPYRVASVTDQIMRLKDLRFDYGGASLMHNHWVFRTESGAYVSVSDGSMVVGLSVVPRS